MAVFSDLIVGTKPLGLWRRPKDGKMFRRFDSRGGQDVDLFIVHHAATTSDAALWGSYTSTARQLSSTYGMARNGDIYGIVGEEFKANTSASKADYRAVTIEIVNSGGESGRPGNAEAWPISQRSFEQLARLIADVATRHRFPIDRAHVIGHREVTGKFGDGYGTRCPGEWLYSRMDELCELARRYQREAAAPPPIGDVRIASTLRLSDWTAYEDPSLSEKVGLITGDVEVVGISGGHFHVETPDGRRLWIHNTAKAGLLSAEALQEEEIMGAADDIIEAIRRESRPRLYEHRETGEQVLVDIRTGYQLGPWKAGEEPPVKPGDFSQLLSIKEGSNRLRVDAEQWVWILEQVDVTLRRIASAVADELQQRGLGE